ncbi:hypothetical protein [Pseudoxanthomonas koreensis]|uniref:hypothetical protein n=1 Tax=Pseudoxanthomonas koreensis TaxID=266061 RepID=UPI0035A6BA29
MTDPHRLRFPRAATAVLLSSAMAVTGCAHSNAPRNNGTDGMTDASTPQALAPPSTAAEMGRRFLKLIGSIESRDELTPELIRRVTGIVLDEVKPDELATGYASGDLGGGWRYILNFVPASASLRTGVALRFQQLHDGVTTMSAICELDFHHYHEAIQSMGFEARPVYGEIGEVRSWRYHKSDFVVGITALDPLAGESGPICVKTIATIN